MNTFYDISIDIVSLKDRKEAIKKIEEMTGRYAYCGHTTHEPYRVLWTDEDGHDGLNGHGCGSRQELTHTINSLLSKGYKQVPPYCLNNIGEL